MKEDQKLKTINDLLFNLDTLPDYTTKEFGSDLKQFLKEEIEKFEDKSLGTNIEEILFYPNSVIKNFNKISFDKEDWLKFKKNLEVE